MTPCGRAHVPLLPLGEAAPVEFIRGADLIGKAKRVEPTLLLGAPPAVPEELEQARFASALDYQGAMEVGAAGACVDEHALDGELGVRVQELREQPDDLHAGDAAREDDAVGFLMRGQGAQGGFERGRRARPLDDSGVDVHGANLVISIGKTVAANHKYSVMVRP